MDYNVGIEEILKRLNSNLRGLTDEEVILSHKRNGNNIILSKEHENPIKVFFKQFDDLLVIILIAASLISLFAKDIESAIVIILVLIINAILGTIQFFKAEASINSLKKVNTSIVKVRRNQEIKEVPQEEVVVGDIVVLEAGDKCPADGRIIKACNLEINESALTGESASVLKSNEMIKANVPLAEQKNMVFGGTLVVKGNAEIIITKVGMDTEIGKIAHMISKAQKGETPLQVNLNRLSKNLALIIGTICSIIFILGIIQGTKLLDSLLFAVALAVAAIPEALSSIVTITLSIGCEKLVNNNAIAKDLKSVEALGSVSVICSDKTGTITQNKMVLDSFFINRGIKKKLDSNNVTESDLIRALAICNKASKAIGNETERAIIEYLDKNSIDYELIRRNNPIVYEEPFDSNRKMMLVKTNNEGYFKGAYDYLLDKITKISIDGVITDLTPPHYYQIISINRKMADEGLRVLLLGKIIDDSFCFLGLIGLIDPPRENVSESIKKCLEANIKVLMITGDHEDTAFSIAKKIGITKKRSEVISGAGLDKVNIDEIEKYKVFSRVTPEHKLKIVEALKKKGEIVAMTGDGINDAPAIRCANIGIAMGKNGTDVAKDAASIILADDDFTTITKAIFIGRVVYNNIKNAICFLLSGNMAGLLTVIFCVCMRLPMPFTAGQLLFINLVTDSLPAIALGMEEYNNSVGKAMPSRNQMIVNKRFLIKATIYGFILGIPCILAFLIGYKESYKLACTMAFSTICIARLFHGFNCLGQGSIIRYGIKNKHQINSLLFGLVLLFGVLFIPTFRDFFEAGYLSYQRLGLIMLLGLIPLFIIQALRLIREVQ